MSLTTLVGITNSLISRYPANTAWNGSSFNWIRSLPPASKGAIGRDIGSGLLYAYGFTPTAKRYELRVNGQSVLVRVAMKWEGNTVKFQNVRDINFDHLLAIALYPNNAYSWLIPKHEIWTNGKVRTSRQGVKAQHKGADAWIDVDPKNIQQWLKPYGGSIQDMIKVAKQEL